MPPPHPMFFGADHVLIPQWLIPKIIRPSPIRPEVLVSSPPKDSSPRSNEPKENSPKSSSPRQKLFARVRTQCLPPPPPIPPITVEFVFRRCPTQLHPQTPSTQELRFMTERMFALPPPLPPPGAGPSEPGAAENVGKTTQENRIPPSERFGVGLSSNNLWSVLQMLVAGLKTHSGSLLLSASVEGKGAEYATIAEDDAADVE